MDTAAAAKSEHDDDDEDVDTPVIHRSPAHHIIPRSSFSDVARLHRHNSYAGSVEDVLGPVPSDCPRGHRQQQLRRTLAVADWLASVNVDDSGDGSSEMDGE